MNRLFFGFTALAMFLVCNLFNAFGGVVFNDVVVNDVVVNDVVVNEIMPAPLNGEPEWIELFNNSSDDIRASGFTINDLKRTVALPEFEIGPYGYAIITKDTALLKSLRDIPESAVMVEIGLPVFNNNYDAAVLRSDGGQILDSLYYDMSWGTKGISLERIDPDRPAVGSDNLAPSKAIEGATPGYENSTVRIIPPLQPEALKINELLFDAAGGTSEFIELWNSTDTLINLYGINIYDGAMVSNHKPVVVYSKSITIKPGAYGVIAGDSAIFDNFPYLAGGPVFISHKSLSLNNSGDMIVIKDASGQTLDSMVFEEKWHNEAINNTRNLSLEKFKPHLPSGDRNSWSSCADPLGATPGRINSLSKATGGFEIVIEPNPFSTQSRNRANCIIKYKLPFKTATITATIHGLNGIELRKLLNADYSSASGEFSWNGSDGNGNILPPGPYILNLEAADSQTGEIVSERKMIVVGE